MPKKDTIVLCRRIISDYGEPIRYCCNPIKTPSNLEWCDKDLSRLPFWPDGPPDKPKRKEKP